MGFDLFHFAGQLGTGRALKHVVSDGGADWKLAKNFEGFISRGCANHLVSFPLEDLFSEHKVSRAILEAKDEWPAC